ncbi:MAG: DUF5671 domain-containing protein [Candidatus Magasanikbacteria bacterium]
MPVKSRSTEKEKASPSDFFLHLLSIVTLYMGAIALLTVFFQLINAVFPDILTDYNYRNIDGIRGSLRFGVAMLIVSFPVYLWTIKYLGMLYVRTPALKNLRVRKWLIYLTLFIASVVIIIDLISLIIHFFEGELSIRIFLKVLAVFFVALAIFWYYLVIVREEEKTQALRYFIYLIYTVIGAALVCSFFVIGSPVAERQRRLDQRRVDALMQMNIGIQIYFDNHGELPNDISMLLSSMPKFESDRIRSMEMKPEYKMTNHTAYRLCAVFESDYEDENEYLRFKGVPMVEETGPMMEDLSPEMHDWSHGRGRSCFDREVFVKNETIKESQSRTNIPARTASLSVIQTSVEIVD